MADPDPSFAPNSNYHGPGGNDWYVGGTLTIGATGTMKVAGTPTTATITPVAGAASSNICLATIQLTDALGVNVTASYVIEVYLSDAATGAGLTATAASGAVAAGAAGTDLKVLTAKKDTLSLTNASGQYILSITDSAKTGYYIAVIIKDKLFVSSQLTTGSYG